MGMTASVTMSIGNDISEAFNIISLLSRKFQFMTLKPGKEVSQ